MLIFWDYIFGVGIVLVYVYAILGIIEKIQNFRKGDK